MFCLVQLNAFLKTPFMIRSQTRVLHTYVIREDANPIHMIVLVRLLPKHMFNLKKEAGAYVFGCFIFLGRLQLGYIMAGADPEQTAYRPLGSV